MQEILAAVFTNGPSLIVSLNQIELGNFIIIVINSPNTVIDIPLVVGGVVLVFDVDLEDISHSIGVSTEVFDDWEFPWLCFHAFKVENVVGVITVS